MTLHVLSMYTQGAYTDDGWYMDLKRLEEKSPELRGNWNFKHFLVQNSDHPLWALILTNNKNVII